MDQGAYTPQISEDYRVKISVFFTHCINMIILSALSLLLWCLSHNLSSIDAISVRHIFHISTSKEANYASRGKTKLMLSIRGGSETPAASGFNTNDPAQFESFEDWRNYQQSRQSMSSPKSEEQMNSPTDEQGRMKLIATISNASIGLFFFILIWRTVHHFELADVTFPKGVLRFCFVVPIVFLFIFNMIGCVSSFTSSSTNHASKKRCKAILNLNKLVEIILCLYNTIRLMIFPSKYIAREIYVGRIFSNFIFLVQCQLFTKVAWDAARVRETLPSSSAFPPSLEDEFKELRREDEQFYENYPQHQQQQQYSPSYEGQS